MNPQQVFVARLDALLAQCDVVEKAIKSDGINPKLYQRAAADLLGRIQGDRTQILGQRSKIQKGTADDGSWVSLHGYEEECSSLFGECLAFLQAGRARGQEVDADLCEIADALLDELASRLTNIQWKRFTVLASEEYFRDSAQIIRLRFPFCGVWDLPISAHEFGHFVAGRLNVARPGGSHYLAFQEYKAAFQTQHGDRGDEWMFYLEEFFADLFATYALGPAYACTCLLLRFDPVSAHAEEDKRHPSYAKRACVILQTLVRLNSEKDSKGDFKPAADALTGFWTQALTSAGQSSAIPDQELLDSLVFSFYEMLKNGAPGARFNRWAEAKKRTQWLKEVKVPLDVKGADVTISDLLNAAWLCRLQPGADLDLLNSNLLGLCRLRTGDE